MPRSAWLFLLTVLFAICSPISAIAQPPEPKNEKERPLQALLVTGGCCHDYHRQKLILARGVSARANVVWTVVHQGGKTTNTPIPLYRDPNWSKGFDIVVHNECFSDVRDKEFVENIVRPHRNGLPAVLIHCAMHCYRTGDDQWFRFVGMQSPGHGPHYSYQADNVKPDHPIMDGFGDRFVAPKGELYHSIKLFDTATVLAQAKRKSDGKPQVCMWTNQYGKGRVFATTIGHYNETMAEPQYLDAVTKGLLWACGKDPQKHFTPSTPEVDAEIKALINVKLDAAAERGAASKQLQGKCCGAGNLVAGVKATASSEETNKNNFAKNAVDGDLRTRWCAQGAAGGEWLQADLGQSKHIRALRIHWEKNAAYRYEVEASPDGQVWKTIVDQTANKKRAMVTPHQVDSPDTRYLKVTFLGATPSFWGSLWELEAYETKDLPKLPKSVSAGQAPAASVTDVRAPEGFNVTMFGSPPDVNYPVCIAAAATGEVFVGVDEQGSLGKDKGRGKVLRCLDTDGDGKADDITVFAKMDHPRGLFYDNGSLWVLHPPNLTVYHDDDLDGVADREETLVTGLTSEQIKRRGADHTTNGIRMGIDGWLYIAVGDFGFTEAKGRDGAVLARRGGGIVRVRPDGTEMEFFSWGQRNILDACVDPYMNVFTRDNTNDGGGWDIRLSHVLQSGEYGYPSLYLNFTEESMPPLADYGGGSGCGGMYLHDVRWPAPFGDALYTCDWGRSEVYRHNLPAHGATFDAHQETFLQIPRPTDIDVDGSGRMYVASWKNGKFNYSGPDVGFVAQVVPANFTPKPFPNLPAASDAELVDYLSAPSAAYRLHAQRELLRRGLNNERIERLLTLAQSDQEPLYGRAAAIFTLGQMPSRAMRDSLIQLLPDAAVREFAVRALTDRQFGLDSKQLLPHLLEALGDSNARVRAQALISLGRLGDAAAAKAILPWTKRGESEPAPTAEPLYKQPDPGRVIPHLAVRALVACDAIDACLAALDGPHADGAAWALKSMHSRPAVDGLIQRLTLARSEASQERILTTLVRLHYREGEYKGGWWGTRPDRTGPYYDRQPWSESERIASALALYTKDAAPSARKFVAEQLARHKVAITGIASAPAASHPAAAAKPVKIPQADPSNPRHIANLGPTTAAVDAYRTKGKSQRGAKLFQSQSCASCHTTANGQAPKGPHLADIGKRYRKEQIIASILNPSAKIAQGFDTYTFALRNGRIVTGFISRESAEDIEIRQTNGLPMTLLKGDVEERKASAGSMMPQGLVNNLTPEQLADLVAYLQSL